MSYLNRKIKSIILSGLLSTGIVTANYVAFNKEVVLIVDGQEIQVSSFQSNVQGVLEENEIDYDSNDIISEDLNASLENGMKIEIKQIEKKIVTEMEDIDFDTIIKEDSSLLKGKTNISQEGQKGTKELVYEMVYENGKLASKTLVEENVIQEAKDLIIKKGTKEKEVIKATNTTSTTNNTAKDSKSSESSLGIKMTVSASAYTGGGITSTGTVPKWGTIAVDPSIIPYGTKIYIPQFDKYFIAEDCGGGIKGNKVDIFMNSESECNSWGRRTIDIYIVK